MPSGRKKRIMVACVTFETVKVTDPVEYYEINKVHIIHYLKEGAAKAGTYAAFYDRVVEIIDDYSRDVEVVEHNERVSDFGVMLRTVLSIIQSEKAEDPDCEIYINVSSGSPEYAAASAIAAMMEEGTIPFSVGVREYTVSDDMIEDLYYMEGKPVGLCKATYEPRALPTYVIDIPPEYLVRGLRILAERNAAKLPVSSRHMVEALKSAGLWFRDTERSDVPPSKVKQVEAVYYQRDFTYRWSTLGWVTRDEHGRKFILTPLGQNAIDTFYVRRFASDGADGHPRSVLRHPPFDNSITHHLLQLNRNSVGSLRAASVICCICAGLNASSD